MHHLSQRIHVTDKDLPKLNKALERWMTRLAAAMGGSDNSETGVTRRGLLLADIA